MCMCYGLHPAHTWLIAELRIYLLFLFLTYLSPDAWPLERSLAPSLFSHSEWGSSATLLSIPPASDTQCVCVPFKGRDSWNQLNHAGANTKTHIGQAAQAPRPRGLSMSLCFFSSASHVPVFFFFNDYYLVSRVHQIRFCNLVTAHHQLWSKLHTRCNYLSVSFSTLSWPHLT